MKTPLIQVLAKHTDEALICLNQLPMSAPSRYRFIMIGNNLQARETAREYVILQRTNCVTPSKHS